MRCWLTLFFILFGAAVVYADAAEQTSVSVPVVTAVLSQSDNQPVNPADTPLYASALSSISSRLNGAETLSVKTRYIGPACVAKYHVGMRFVSCFSSCLRRAADVRPRGGMRAVDRYVYALRRIII